MVGLGMIATFLSLIVKEQKPTFAFMIVVFTRLYDFFVLSGSGVRDHPHDRKDSRQCKYQHDVCRNDFENYRDRIYSGVWRTADKGCRAGAIASKIELAGKILILVMAVPILTVIIETIIGLIPSMS
ncbi:SpoIIIAC/SpoIIIAD family protein [Bacillus sonorensis]|nr:SpoIIIAC/SpoIIIAD family protein [Bacillus sonorensis]